MRVWEAAHLEFRMNRQEEIMKNKSLWEMFAATGKCDGLSCSDCPVHPYSHYNCKSLSREQIVEFLNRRAEV